MVSCQEPSPLEGSKTLSNVTPMTHALLFVSMGLEARCPPFKSTAHCHHMKRQPFICNGRPCRGHGHRHCHLRCHLCCRHQLHHHRCCHCRHNRPSPSPLPSAIAIAVAINHCCRHLCCVAVSHCCCCCRCPCRQPLLSPSPSAMATLTNNFL